MTDGGWLTKTLFLRRTEANLRTACWLLEWDVAIFQEYVKKRKGRISRSRE